MSSQRILRGHPRRGLACALALSTSTAVATGLVAAASAQDPPPAIRIQDAAVRYGQPVRVDGYAGRARAGRPMTLEFHGASGGWRTLRTARTGADGRFAVRVRPPGSGSLRAAIGSGQPATGARSAGTPRPQAATSAPRRVTVAAEVAVRRRALDVRAGRPASVAGVLRPAQPGHTVALEVRRRGRWATVARARTRGAGRYRLRYSPRRAGTLRVRVAFRGDRGAGPAARPAGRLNAYRRTRASWYALYGNALACGGRMRSGQLGVAHRTLPCGTKVTFRYRGRTVRVPVIDRGPFVGGRDWDLTAATARRLGFHGTGSLWATR